MSEIKYQTPYFNTVSELRQAYQTLHPTYSFDMVSSVMVGALSVYVPEEKFNELVASIMSEANAKLNSTN